MNVSSSENISAKSIADGFEIMDSTLKSTYDNSTDGFANIGNGTTTEENEVLTM